ncbi:hypothetical protein N7474_010923 [Penicillium riverlandense]|uniref:uncharacterized protein n=1 Tax=Penicillium riverlandense TaxID=1903569 RepID=UPI002547B7DB|nr:uncharacterized protein N7474_010923 [Penicillium riverlandense]KAJ5805036.1 hypothetical protein N7474_010923 [Penicillium riverlandense]
MTSGAFGFVQPIANVHPSPVLSRAIVSPTSSLRSQQTWYYVPRHVGGVNLSTLTQAGTLAGSFGVAAGVFAVFFFGEVPRVRKDILQKIPGLDVYFDRTVAPEDNPF